MKKIFILCLLIAPIIANAVGPAPVDNVNNAVLADYYGPYATADILPGDSTTAVSASYVKGAYNDVIAGLNKKQDNLMATDEYEEDIEISSIVVNTPDFAWYIENFESVDDTNLATAKATATAIANVNNQLDAKRVNALATWGSNTVTKVPLVNQ